MKEQVIVNDIVPTCISDISSLTGIWGIYRGLWEICKCGKFKMLSGLQLLWSPFPQIFLVQRNRMGKS